MIPAESNVLLKITGTNLAYKVRTYFQRRENRQRFQTWYGEKYGTVYVWKR